MKKAEIQQLSDVELRREALQRFAHGVLPLEQWAFVFANTDLAQWPGLRSKAFYVWLPTTLDYIRRYRVFVDIADVAHGRGIDLFELPKLAAELNGHFVAVLSLFDRDEQMFVRDRRLQCVHGVLDQYSRSDVTIEWFDSAVGEVAEAKFTAEGYWMAIRRFYEDMQASSIAMLQRLVSSPAFDSLKTSYFTKMRFDPHIIDLAARLGLQGLSASEGR